MSLAVVPAWRASIDLGLRVNLPSFVLGIAILACYAAKVLVVSHLDRRGGDARAYVKSSELVTDGPYGWSRHPTYAVAMLQFLLWSALALLLQALSALESRSCSPPPSDCRSPSISSTIAS